MWFVVMLWFLVGVLLSLVVMYVVFVVGGVLCYVLVFSGVVYVCGCVLWCWVWGCVWWVGLVLLFVGLDVVLCLYCVCFCGVCVCDF